MLGDVFSGPYFVLGLIVLAAVAMASNKVRYDFIALCVVLALVVNDTLTLSDAFAGFGHPVVILVACLLVIGDVLDRTGGQAVSESTLPALAEHPQPVCWCC